MIITFERRVPSLQAPGRIQRHSGFILCLLLRFIVILFASQKEALVKTDMMPKEGERHLTVLEGSVVLRAVRRNSSVDTPPFF